MVVRVHAKQRHYKQKKDVPKDCLPILVILHQEHSTSGRIGQIIDQLGAKIDIRRPRFGDPLPKTMGDHAGAIIFGGPMSANDSDGFIKDEIEWINVPLKERKPFLGVCLGAQMLARNLGQRVYAHDSGRAEVGYCAIKPTEAGHAICAKPFPERVYQWHREGFELPKDATLLASGEEFRVQACRYGLNAYGLQFHPEVTYAMMIRWGVRAFQLTQAPGGRPPHEHREDWYQYDQAVNLWTRDFLRNWLDAKSAV